MPEQDGAAPDRADFRTNLPRSGPLQSDSSTGPAPVRPNAQSDHSSRKFAAEVDLKAGTTANPGHPGSTCRPTLRPVSTTRSGTACGQDTTRQGVMEDAAGRAPAAHPCSPRKEVAPSGS
ncbi:hypothetical protein GCM10020229_23200 [Kitasatospora albolonga]